jgi:hypothetical protein
VANLSPPAPSPRDRPESVPGPDLSWRTSENAQNANFAKTEF